MAQAVYETTVTNTDGTLTVSPNSGDIVAAVNKAGLPDPMEYSYFGGL